MILTEGRPEILRMSELNDNSELQKYSSAVLYVLSAVDPPEEYVGVIADSFLQAIKLSTVSSHPSYHFSNHSHFISPGAFVSRHFPRCSSSTIGTS